MNFNQSLANVTVLTTGGTIAESGSTSVQTTNYGTPNATFQDLVNAVPELISVANLVGYAIANTDSQSINSTVLLRLNQRVTSELASDLTQGVVITHGTDTMEETAFFLDLTTQSAKTVVVVGSMRPASALSADGPLNLFQAVSLAVNPKAVGRGTLVTLNDRITSAFYVSKNHANVPDAFYAREQGHLGLFLNQAANFYYEPAQPVGKPFFDIAPLNLTTLPMVDILYAHIESNPGLIQASVNLGAKGIVFAGTGAGDLPEHVLDAARDVWNSTKIPMVFASRAMNGFVPYPDSDPWRIPSAHLTPQKARIMLQLGLATGLNGTAIHSLFDDLQI
ncbi:hypothetical protein AAFC00_006503 [Neodothiora populina]